MVQRTISEAANCLGELIDQIEGGPVVIIRDSELCEAAAYLISPSQMETLREVEKKQWNALGMYEVWCRSLEHELNPDAGKLGDDDINRITHESR
jgi:3,4-dihydroxy-2-butanone 4-phosphate synthase